MLGRTWWVTGMLMLAGCGGRAVSTGPMEVPDGNLLYPSYYDSKGALGAWGDAPHGLGLVFRQEAGKPVCHLLFFGEGRKILKDVIQPVRFEANPARLWIGRREYLRTHDWNPSATKK